MTTAWFAAWMPSASAAARKGVAAVKYYVCPTCGFTTPKRDFKNCPSCATPSDKFREIA